MKLRLETKNQVDEVGQSLQGSGIMLTPAINEAYWQFRVKLSETQAIVAFPKFNTFGIGFQNEEDWNTNLPYTVNTYEIYDHIRHNKQDESIKTNDCIAAIQIVQNAVKALKAAL